MESLKTALEEIGASMYKEGAQGSSAGSEAGAPGPDEGGDPNATDTDFKVEK